MVNVIIGDEVVRLSRGAVLRWQLDVDTAIHDPRGRQVEYLYVLIGIAVDGNGFVSKATDDVSAAIGV